MRVDVSTPVALLERLTSADAGRAGGKAFNCARLKQAGFPVPDGIVILADAKDDEIGVVGEHPWFDTVPPGSLFAVRSSGIGEDGPAQSFAGIHETFLNVPRHGVSAAVAACRASACSERALAYRRANGMPIDAIQIAVLVQLMIHPSAAGVAFTINPLTGSTDEIVVNAARGLGEALVSGTIDPDEYVVHKSDRRLLLRRLGDDGGEATPVLGDGDITALVAMLQRIEHHYGAPQDVEWCRDEAGFWIVQSRPVTAAAPRQGRDIEWTRANLAEVLPDLTSPQALTAFEEMLNSAERMNFRRLAAPDAELGPLVKQFAGRLYFNLSQMRHVSRIGGFAPAATLRSLGHSEAISPADEVATRPPLGDLLPILPDFARLAWRHLRVARVVDVHNERTARKLARFKAVDPARTSDADLWAGLEEWLRDGPEEMQTVLLLGGVMFHETPVRKVCEKVGFPYERLVYPQLATGERSVSSQQAFDLVALADIARREPRAASFIASASPEQLAEFRTALTGTAFLAAFDRFLAAYGHRGRYESDWALPKYHEDPSPLLNALRAHLSAPPADDASATVARQEREAAEAWTAFSKRLSWWQRLVTLPRVRRAVATVKRYYVWREQVRSDLVRVMSLLRPWHLTLADRFVSRGWLDDRSDYFLLYWPEVGAVIAGNAPPESLRPIAAARKAELDRYRQLRMPLLMKEADLPRLLRTAGVSGGADTDGALTGHPVSAGRVEAEVVVIRDPADFGRMKRGAILVAPATDPSWTPLFTLAAGVIVEVGGVLSHASTIAREFGLPAVANVKNATKRLKTGERVRLDAVEGRIDRI
jgi:pyruvate,water dikinase